MPARSVSAPHNARPLPSPQFADNAAVRSALGWFSRNLTLINEQQAHLTEIPAPPFGEAARSEWLKQRFIALGLENVQVDELGNVIGLLDFGMVGRIDERMREQIEDILMAIVQHDVPLLVRIIKQLGRAPPQLDEAGLANDVADFRIREMLDQVPD